MRTIRLSRCRLYPLSYHSLPCFLLPLVTFSISRLFLSHSHRMHHSHFSLLISHSLSLSLVHSDNTFLRQLRYSRFLRTFITEITFVRNSSQRKRVLLDETLFARVHLDWKPEIPLNLGRRYRLLRFSLDLRQSNPEEKIRSGSRRTRRIRIAITLLARFR